MKVLVTGSRDFKDWPRMWKELDEAKADIVIHGAALGADLMSEAWAKKNQRNYRGYPAKWDLHGKSAGPRRNADMLIKEHREDEPIDRVFAYPLPGSIGTIDMIDRCVAAHIRTFVNGVEIRYARETESFAEWLDRQSK
jgi:hypothetical protein